MADLQSAALASWLRAEAPESYWRRDFGSREWRRKVSAGGLCETGSCSKTDRPSTGSVESIIPKIGAMRGSARVQVAGHSGRVGHAPH